MNVEEYRQLANQVDALNESLDDIKKIVTALKLNEQSHVTKNKKIQPGIACKVAYDSNGLVLSGIGLDASDIPVLQIDAINGLRSMLEDKLDKSHYKELQTEMSNLILKKGNIVSSGIKVNYDKNGLIVSSSDELTIDDIPSLPVSKVDGLSDRLEILESYHNEDNIRTITVDDIKVNPGTFTKITFDELGRVLKGTKLSLDDLPNELISNINKIDSKLLELASQKVVNSLVDSVSKKLDANSSIVSGTFTKVKVDSKGLVTEGTNLTTNDIPSSILDDIDDLKTEMKTKVTNESFLQLYDDVSIIIDKMNDISNIKDLQSKIDRKAEDSDVKNISSQLSSLQTLVDTLNEKIVNDTIMEQLSIIENQLSTLSGRISVIETKLNINE